MSLMELAAQIRAMRFPDAFNPYADYCATFDHEDAPDIRFRMLTDTLAAAAREDVDSLWVGRDLGHRGGRRTGLAFTDDVHLPVHLGRWRVASERPTLGQPIEERTARVIWGALKRIIRPVYLWNVFPLHPHEPGKPLSNRMHRRDERKAGLEVLSEVISTIRPRRVVAVGNDADDAVGRIGGDFEFVKVRHPSYGGQVEFVQGIERLYGLPSEAKPRTLL